MPQNESFEIHYQRALRRLAPVENQRMQQGMSGKRPIQDEAETAPAKSSEIDTALVSCLEGMKEATVGDLKHKMRKAGYQLSPQAISQKMRSMGELGLVKSNDAKEADVRIWSVKKSHGAD